MTTENTPGEQTNTGSQQQATPPEGFIELARYNGLVRKVDELVKQLKTKDDEIVAAKGEAERAKADLVEKDASTKVAVSERDKRLEDAVTKKSEMEAELKELRSLKAKLEVAKEIGHPELLGIIEKLPDVENKDAMKMIFEDIVKFADDKAKKREEQLMAGITSQTSGVRTNSINNTPSTEAEWNSHLEKQQLGTPEYQKALDDFWNWQIKNHK